MLHCTTYTINRSCRYYKHCIPLKQTVCYLQLFLMLLCYVNSSKMNINIVKQNSGLSLYRKWRNRSRRRKWKRRNWCLSYVERINSHSLGAVVCLINPHQAVSQLKHVVSKANDDKLGILGPLLMIEQQDMCVLIYCRTKTQSGDIFWMYMLPQMLSPHIYNVIVAILLGIWPANQPSTGEV